MRPANTKPQPKASLFEECCGDTWPLGATAAPAATGAAAAATATSSTAGAATAAAAGGGGGAAASYRKGVHYSTLEIGKEDMKFSAAHYTVFSATERERLHGHTHAVRVRFTGPVAGDGMVSNYALFKSRVRALCQKYDETYLVPGDSPHIKIAYAESASGDHIIRITHNGLAQELPADDVRVLGVTNVTLEELSMLLLQEVVAPSPGGEGSWAEAHGIIAVTVQVSSDGGRGQWAATSWNMQYGFGCPTV